VAFRGKIGIGYERQSPQLVKKRPDVRFRLHYVHYYCMSITNYRGRRTAKDIADAP
jgi:hypothetical protein